MAIVDEEGKFIFQPVTVMFVLDGDIIAQCSECTWYLCGGYYELDGAVTSYRNLDGTHVVRRYNLLLVI